MPAAETDCSWYKHVTSSSQTFTKFSSKKGNENRNIKRKGNYASSTHQKKKKVLEKREQETGDKLKQFRKI